MGHVYILLLKHKKYYVGYSDKIINRIDEHFNNNGSRWTTMYPIVKVLMIRRGTKKDEANITRKLMKDYGIDNVRGGPWCTTNLYEDPFDPNSRLYADHINDKCFNCRRKGHFASDCIYSSYKTKNVDDLICFNNNTGHYTSKMGNLICFNCNKIGHYASDCEEIKLIGFNNSNTSENENRRCNMGDLICFKCDKIGHYASECKNINKIS